MVRSSRAAGFVEPPRRTAGSAGISLPDTPPLVKWGSFEKWPSPLEPHIMAVQVSCPPCGTSYRLSEQQAMQQVRCKKCNGVFQVKKR